MEPLLVGLFCLSQLRQDMALMREGVKLKKTFHMHSMVCLDAPYYSCLPVVPMFLVSKSKSFCNHFSYRCTSIVMCYHVVHCKYLWNIAVAIVYTLLLVQTFFCVFAERCAGGLWRHYQRSTPRGNRYVPTAQKYARLHQRRGQGHATGASAERHRDHCHSCFHQASSLRGKC